MYTKAVSREICKCGSERNVYCLKLLRFSDTEEDKYRNALLSHLIWRRNVPYILKSVNLQAVKGHSAHLC